jgi:membrane protein YdbS with pleckstrin-like domain
MGYPQSLLSEGETIAFELKPHWRALLVPAIVLIADVFLGAWLYFTFDNPWVRWPILIIAVVVLIPGTIIPMARWLTTQFVFTNRRIIVRRGLVSKTGRDMPLSKVNNVSFEVGVMGRILNYGTLSVESASENGDLIIDDVPNVEVIQREVYRLHEEDDERRRRRSQQLGGDPVPPNDGT